MYSAASADMDDDGKVDLIITKCVAMVLRQPRSMLVTCC